MSRTTWLTLIFAGLMMGLWYLAARGARPDPEVAEVAQIWTRLAGASSQRLSPDVRRHLYMELRDRISQLTLEKTDEAREIIEQIRRQQAQQAADRYFALSADSRSAFLDAQLERYEEQLARARIRRWRPARSPEEVAVRELLAPRPVWYEVPVRESRRQAHLDESSPEARARRVEFFRVMRSRYEERQQASETELEPEMPSWPALTSERSPVWSWGNRRPMSGGAYGE
jgi:hypothetical protein